MENFADRENFGIDDERFSIILSQVITAALTSDQMLNVVVDSEVEHRLGLGATVEGSEVSTTALANCRAQIMLEGLEGTMDCIASLVVHNLDPEASAEAMTRAREAVIEVPDDLSGLDWA